MRTVMRKTIKKTTLKALRSTGAFAASAGSSRRRDRLLILCYHGISLRDEEHAWGPTMYLTEAHFPPEARSVAVRPHRSSATR